jgi:predicted dehydrogenase
MYGKILMRAFLKDERSNITWVNSASEATTKSAAAEFGVENWSTDYHDVLADTNVDAVIIASPPFVHAEQLEDALKAGKHVLLEKPIAESRESLQRILKAVKSEPSLKVLEASCRHTRLSRKFQFIKDMIESGKLGEIYHIHHNTLSRGTFIEYNPKGAWAMDKELAGGGPFADRGVYDLAFHLGLLNDVPQLKSVKSFTRNDLRDMSKYVEFSDVEQHGAAWMEFDTGLTYYYENGGGVHNETPNETRIYGTKGGLKFQHYTWDTNEIEFFTTEDGEPCREVFNVDITGQPDDSLAITTHFVDYLEGKTEPLMTVPLAAKHMEILFKIMEG